MSTRSLKSGIHRALVRQREAIMDADPNDDGYVENQALHCPHYVPLDGEWGGDWGAILHPASRKFGQLVFEHEWCGCSTHFGFEDTA